MDNFGNNLRKLRNEKRLTLEELANVANRKYGVNFNKGMISKWENGHPAKLASIKVLSLFFDVTLNELLGFNEKERKDKIPVFREVTSNDSKSLEENIIGYGHPPPLLALNESFMEDLFYLRVQGDGMDREYPEGTLVLVRKNIPVVDGDNAVVFLDGIETGILIKLKIEDNLITLIPSSTNPEHLPQTINTNEKRVEIVGKVIGSYRI